MSEDCFEKKLRRKANKLGFIIHKCRSLPSYGSKGRYVVIDPYRQCICNPGNGFEYIGWSLEEVADFLQQKLVS